MTELQAPQYNNQPIATLAVLADYLGTSKKTLQGNLAKNPDKFIHGKHYFNISHENLKSTSSRLLEAFDYKGKNGLQVWTERGCARLSKLLRTDEAWDLWEKMEDSYFNSSKSKTQLPTAIEIGRLYVKSLEALENKDRLLLISNEAHIKVGEITITEFVKSTDAIDIGRKKFFDWMRYSGYIFKDSRQPIQKFVDNGWFTWKPSDEKHNDKFRMELMITPKGRVMLADKYRQACGIPLD